MQTKNWLAMAVVVLGLAVETMATPIVTVGNYQLQPNTSNQLITLNVTGADAVTGFNLRAAIGDGSGAAAEPKFSAISFVSGTIWDAHPSTTTGGPITGLTQDAQASVVFNTSGDSVPATGAFVKLFIDTTGFTTGTYNLSLTGTEIGSPSRFIGTSGSEITTTITNGTITVPEPATGMILVGVTFVLCRRQRTRHIANTML
jgi:hypothetical protein